MWGFLFLLREVYFNNELDTKKILIFNFRGIYETRLETYLTISLGWKNILIGKSFYNKQKENYGCKEHR